MQNEKHLAEKLLLVEEPYQSDAVKEPNFHLVAPDTPLISVTDLGLIRGVGAFEVIHGVDGKLIAALGHLERLVTSCQRLGFPEVSIENWVAAIRYLMADSEFFGEFYLRLVITGGGPEGHKAWIHAVAVEPETIQRRGASRAAMSLDRGVSSEHNHENMPWLLNGVKSLSYGENMIAQTYAHAQGFDDAIYFSHDGFILEAPTASVLMLKDGKLLTPDHELGILPGTSQRLFYNHLDDFGLSADFVRYTKEDIRQVEGLWLVSAVRLVSGISRLDDIDIPTDPKLTKRFNDFLLASAETL